MSSILTICENIRTRCPDSLRRISNLSRRINLPLPRTKDYKIVGSIIARGRGVGHELGLDAGGGGGEVGLIRG